jgi:hypothetical protein
MLCSIYGCNWCFNEQYVRLPCIQSNPWRPRCIICIIYRLYPPPRSPPHQAASIESHGDANAQFEKFCGISAKTTLLALHLSGTPLPGRTVSNARPMCPGCGTCEPRHAPSSALSTVCFCWARPSLKLSIQRQKCLSCSPSRGRSSCKLGGRSAPRMLPKFCRHPRNDGPSRMRGRRAATCSRSECRVPACVPSTKHGGFPYVSNTKHSVIGNAIALPR